MKKELLQFVDKTRNTVSKNSPMILTGLGVAGLVTTTVMAVKATPKVMDIINNERHNRADKDEHFIYGETPIPKIDLIKLTWKCYIPTFIMGGFTIACIISANNISTKRSAALASLYSLTDATLKEYQNKVVEVIGVNKERDIRDDIAGDKLHRDPVDRKEVIITGSGEMLCYDTISGRYFKNDIEQLRRIQNDLNKSLLTDMWVSLNELYYAFGLDGVKMGDELGWNGYDSSIELDFSSKLTPDGQPCVVIDYAMDPKHDFSHA